MKTFVTAVLSLHFLAGIASAQRVDEARLRQALRLPTLSVTSQLGFDSTDGFYLCDADRDHTAEIATLEKALKGDLSDAGRYYRLSDLYEKIDEKRAKAAADKAYSLLRQQVKVHPNSGRLLAECALAMNIPDSEKEAEKMALRAIELAPRDWFPRFALGELYGKHALGDLLLKKNADLAGLLETIAAGKVPPEKLESAQRYFDVAIKCFDQASTLAPIEPEILRRRACLRVVYGFFKAALLQADGQKVNVMASWASDAFRADLRKLAELRPNDRRALTMSAFVEGFAVILLDQEKASAAIKSGGSLIAALPDQSRTSVRESLRQLDRLANGKDRKEAAAAAETLGMVYITALQDYASGEAALRHAIELDPNRDQPWEFLMALFMTNDREKECLDLCLARLKHKDSPRNRFATARAYDGTGKSDKVEEQARLGLKHDPRDMPCNLALAVVFLRRVGPQSLDAAGLYLDAVEKLLNDSTPADLRNDYDATRAVFLALDGQLRKSQTMLKEVLERDGEHKIAKPALAAFGQ